MPEFAVGDVREVHFPRQIMGHPTGETRPFAQLFARRPAVPLAALFVLGAFSYRAVPPGPLICALCIASALVVAIIWRDRPVVCTLGLASAMFASGLTIAQLEAFYYPRNNISQFATEQPRLAELEIDIDNEPRVLFDPFSPRPMPPKQIVTASVKRVRTWSGWEDSCGRILVQIAQPNPRLAISQRVRVLGMLERPAPAMNPGQFNWAEYYRDQRVLTSMHIPMAANIQILSQHPSGPLTFIRQSSRRLLAQGFTAAQSLDHALLRALLLGDRDPELRDVQDQFRRTGTSHHLAISGMHIAVLAGFVLLVARFLRLRPRIALAVMGAFAVVYGIAALPSPPVVRSILLCLLIALGSAARRTIDPFQLLAVSVLAMLIYSPLDAFNAGFQLSFGTVLGLMIFTRPLIAWWRRVRGEEAFPPSGRQGALSRAGLMGESMFAGVFAAALVAWVVSMPLVAYHFEQLNPWAIPASIILGPIVFVALISGLAKIVLSLLFPSLSGAWATMSAAPIAFMRTVLSWLAQLPWSDFPLPAMPLWTLAIIYALLLALLLPCPVPKLRLVMRIAPLGLCIAAVLLPLRNIQRTIGPPRLTLTLLAVGAGQCAVLQTPGGRTIIIDAGSNSLSDPLRKCVAPFLRHRGCTSVDTLLLTHSDYDHISAAGAIAQVYDVREVLTGSQFRYNALDNPPAEALLRSLESIDLSPRVVQPGEKIPLGRDVEVEVLWPPLRASPRSSNDGSVVARIGYAGRSILVTGDIQESAQGALLERYRTEQLHADVLIAPHHGSTESTTADFLLAVDPSIIISSNDRSLTGKQKR
ncbi:MAG: DNA internalization-related competence protein ComEC/Rec2, partial [Tepidisphaeraceae bacterium]